MRVGERLFIVILSCISASIIVMSFLYGLTTLYSLVKDLKRKVWIDPPVDQFKLEISDLPRIAIVIPLYREDRHSIMETFISIVNQLYPSDKLSVFVILENGDENTKKHVEELKNILIASKINIQIYINNGKRIGKAVAINSVLPRIMDGHEAVLILDAGDRILDKNYILKCVELLRKGYNIIGTKVYRVGGNIIAKFSYIDTVLWYNVSFPAIHSITGIPFLSGEGMFVNTKFLKNIGGFPEVLAEDSYIAMLGFIHGEKVGLINSIILEGAPSTFTSLIKQRLRWYRGGFECFKGFIMKHRKNIPQRIVIKVCFAYLQTITLTAPFISLLIMTLSLFADIPSILITLAKIEIVSILLSPLILYFTLEIKELSLFLAPMNWFLQSFIAFVALLPIKISWFRTTNRFSISPLHYSIPTNRIQHKRR